MFFKLLTLMVMTACITGHTQAATTKKSEDKVTALYVKDGNSGQLRFLGAGLNPEKIGQLITNKQDFLEQFRPTGTADNNGGVIIIDDGSVVPPTTLGTGTGTGTGIGGTGTGADIVTTGPGNGIGTIAGVRPIVINAGGSGGNVGGAAGGNGALDAAIYGASPVADILPQIVAQAVLQQRRGPNRRRVPNRRRRPVRRNGVKRNGNRKVYVIRPKV